jgi:hypothetical protein
MNSTSLFVTVERPCEETISWAIQLLKNAGLRVISTFDLREARHSHPDCPCPNHGTEACDCQMSILLIYHGTQPPEALLVHSFHETTWLYLVDTPEQPVNHALDSLIRKILSQPIPDLIEKTEYRLHSQGITRENP